MKKSELREMFVAEALIVIDEIMAADKHPRANEIRERCAARFRRIDMRAALVIAQVEGLEVARARWRATVRPAILRAIADLRPS